MAKHFLRVFGIAFLLGGFALWAWPSLKLTVGKMSPAPVEFHGLSKFLLGLAPICWGTVLVWARDQTLWSRGAAWPMPVLIGGFVVGALAFFV